ncbi:ATP-binding protein [Streptosporangium sp. NBC_01755]|uniref:ATP-binding protein n=1 Tax=unclassified Streptosporangium TaxID=2632669 RepID=UPI002DD98886|nr:MULTISPECIES: ATP-binding protein [unclassified Streptosporangium]WSA27592.1 ATP-binding protein [Streptosporangium sp. NBC_01810]WSD00938.1 ATP-binding protein [Streptosporangium sp. NBC_01755]
MPARLLSALVGVLADRFRTPADSAMRSPHLGRIPGWSAPLGHTPVFSQRFAATPDQVRPARIFVTEVLGDDHPLRDDAVLLTSELATNAVEHSSGPRDAGPIDPPREFVVTVAFLPHGVLITVQDPGASEIPGTRKPGLDATGGRGLMLVNELATRWGFHRDLSGTVIWFELGLPGR